MGRQEMVVMPQAHGISPPPTPQSRCPANPSGELWGQGVLRAGREARMPAFGWFPPKSPQLSEYRGLRVPTTGDPPI